ncbi:MAG: archease [Syntrophales bacterium]|nr:archease [Syntrophales bacterium]
MKRYKVFDHTADLGLEIYGKDERELFSNAAFAIFDLTVDLHDVNASEVRRVSVRGSDREDLFVNYLREILYMLNGEGMLLKDFSIREISSRHLVGEVRGEAFNPERHSIKTEIKAVTYHQVEVEKNKEGWKARVIFDV